MENEVIEEQVVKAPVLGIGSAVRTHDGIVGLLASFTDSKEYCKVKYEENSEVKFRSFEVSKVTSIQVLPLVDEANRLAVEPYNKDFLHIVAAQLGISRKYFGGYTYLVPAHLRAKVYPKALRSKYAVLNKIIFGAKVERVENEKKEVAHIRLI